MSATGGVSLNFAGLDNEADCDAVFPASAAFEHLRTAYDPDGLLAAAADQP